MIVEGIGCKCSEEYKFLEDRKMCDKYVIKEVVNIDLLIV